MITANRNIEKKQASQLKEHPIKTTALHYIREMIETERYEDLPETLAVAREFGATEWEIRIALMRKAKGE